MYVVSIYDTSSIDMTNDKNIIDCFGDELTINDLRMCLSLEMLPTATRRTLNTPIFEPHGR